MRLWALILLLAAGPAHALSCAPPDPFAAFNRFAAAEETYVAVYGVFTFDPNAMPGRFARSTSVDATFDGEGLDRDGFTGPVARRVTLDVACALSWCGGLQTGTPVLAFLERQDDGLHLALSPCQVAHFIDITAPDLRRIEACFAAGRCPAE